MNPAIKEGQTVEKGDLLYEADLDFFKSKGVNTMTPFVFTKEDDLKGKKIVLKKGAHNVKDEMLVLEEVAAPKAAPEKKKKKGINFDFLQKLGKALMTVIAVMPAAGLMISLGKVFQMFGADVAFVMTIGSVMEQIGWAVINNLHILFAAAIGGNWAKDRAGGAFAENHCSDRNQRQDDRIQYAAGHADDGRQACDEQQDGLQH